MGASTIGATEGGGVACKRLPPLRSEEIFEAYRSCFQAQLRAFEAHGIPVLATELHRMDGVGSGPVAYCVQPLVDRHALVPPRLDREATLAGVELVETILERALAYVAPTRGFDGQLSNWMVQNGELLYLDVTTPLLRDENGAEAARRIEEIARGAGASDLVLCLISGGGSALLIAPVGGISLEDKQNATKLLLACGATIHEFNTVRKHLSRAKGGPPSCRGDRSSRAARSRQSRASVSLPEGASGEPAQPHLASKDISKAPPGLRARAILG